MEQFQSSDRQKDDRNRVIRTVVVSYYRFNPAIAKKTIATCSHSRPGSGLLHRFNPAIAKKTIATGYQGESPRRRGCFNPAIAKKTIATVSREFNHFDF